MGRDFLKHLRSCWNPGFKQLFCRFALA